MKMIDPHVHMTSRTTDDYVPWRRLDRGARRAGVLAGTAAHHPLAAS